MATFAGGLLAEPFRISDRSLNRVLHAAAGVVVAVVAIKDDLHRGGHRSVQRRPAQAGVLVVGAGLLSVAVIEDLIVEAHNSAKDLKGTLLFFVAGFVLFTLVSAGLGEGS